MLRLDYPAWSKISVFEMAKAKKLKLTLKALHYAKLFHAGMFRADGRPAVTHPIRVCQILIYYGVLEDAILAAALLHDVMEDVSERTIDILAEHFPEEVLSWLFFLTKKKDVSVMLYSRRISQNIGAVIIKLADRLHNLRNMVKYLHRGIFFTRQRLFRQTKETKETILKIPVWCGEYEKKFPSSKRKYLPIMEKMALELKEAMHLAQRRLVE